MALDLQRSGGNVVTGPRTLRARYATTANWRNRASSRAHLTDNEKIYCWWIEQRNAEKQAVSDHHAGRACGPQKPLPPIQGKGFSSKQTHAPRLAPSHSKVPREVGVRHGVSFEALRLL